MEQHQLQHNGPIDEEPSFVPFNNGVTNCGVVLVNNLGGLTQRDLGGVVPAVGRAPESRWISVHSRFAKAKFQLQLCQPIEGPFAEEFDKVVQTLQGKIAQTGDRCNVIVSDMSSKLIRFTSNVFEKRKQPVPKHTVYLADLDGEEGRKEGKVPACDSRSTTDGSTDRTPVMYTETEKWPIPVKHKEEFDFMACPLGVYRDTAFVEPSEVSEALEGAFVEAVFAIRHYYLRGKKFDPYQADIQQIKVIEPGASIAASGFKRRNAREGPSGVMIGASTVGKDKEGGRAV
ncbi:hypothetical protein M405DRAFT_891514 [Rhizopogon salebrosus TDB-379]|nr:hypothetical protein M405DRAFT_891514 [Rhizopogon salebrosus TDB-379]